MKLIFTGYAHRLDGRLRDAGFAGELNFADCAATLLPWQEALEQPFRIVFAGPAAGTMSGRRLGEALGESNLVCCDVGGTSTDVSLVVDGAPFVDNTFELEHDLIINALSTEISSVGAGGGSIVSISASGDVVVGPASAGSDPGPACYGRGGTRPTVTDAALLMGILDPDGFAGGALRLDPELARRAVRVAGDAAPAGAAHRVRLPDRGREHRRGGHERRAPARRRPPRLHPGRVRRGRADAPAGGARPDARPARRRPAAPGNFSALGLLSTDLVYYDVRSAYVPLFPESAPQIERGLRGDGSAGCASAPARTARSAAASTAGCSARAGRRRSCRSRTGRSTSPTWSSASTTTYERRYGNRFPSIPVQGVSYRVELRVPAEKVEFAPLRRRRADARRRADDRAPPLRRRAAQAAEHERGALPVGARIAGPAVIREGLATTFVVPGQTARGRDASASS